LSEADLICSIALSRGAAVAAFQRIKAAVIPAGRVSEFAVWRRGWVGPVASGPAIAAFVAQRSSSLSPWSCL